MMRPLTAAIACALAFAAAPASAYENSQFSGTFTCTVGPLVVATTYTPDGRFASRGVMTDAPTPNGVIDLTLTMNGAWSIAGDQLSEAGDAYEIVSISVDDTPLDPGSEMYTQMRAGMDQSLGETVTRTVHDLGAQSMTVSYQGSPQIVCPRS